MKKNVVLIFEIVAMMAIFLAPVSLFYIDSGLLFPFITGKNFLWRFMAEVAFVAWASLAFLSFNYKFNWKTNWVFLSVTAFIAIVFLADMFGVDPYRSFWSNAERMDGFIGTIHQYIYFVALIGLFQSKKMFHWFLHGLLGTGLVMGIIGLGQEKTRIDARLGNPIYLGSMVMFCIFISAYFAVMKEKVGKMTYAREIVYGLLMLFFAFVLVKSGTRGALLGLGMGAITSAVLIVWKTNYREEKMWWVISAIGIGIFFTLMGAFMARSQLSTLPFVENTQFLSRVANISLEDTTTIHRLANWQMALEGVAERPLLGWGQENYIVVFSKYYKPEILYNAEQWFDRTHNTLLDWLVFTGVLGFTAFAMMFVFLFITIWKRSTGYEFTNSEKAILTGLFVGYIFQNLVAFDSLVSGIYFFSIVAFIASSSKRQEHNKNKRGGFNYEAYAPIAIPLMLAFFVFWVNYSILNPRDHAHNYLDFLRPVNTADANVEWKYRSDKLVAVFNQKSLFSKEFAEQTTSRANGFLTDAVPEEYARVMVEAIPVAVEEALAEAPNDVRLNLFYGNFLNSLGQPAVAETYLRKANEYSPKKIQILWILGNNMQRQGKNAEAVPFFQKAVELAPLHTQSKQLLEQAQQLATQ